MRRIVYTAFLFLLCGQWAWSDNVAETYFNGYKDALTAVWNNPFSYESIRSKDAPRGPYMGNGDVGVIAYASANSQTLRFSKVNFVTDGVADWAGTGPAALPVAEVSMGVDAPVGDDFRFEMCQPTARFVMHTSTRPTVRMETWMSMSDNYVVTEVTNLSDSPVSAWVETHGLPSPIYSSDVAVDDDVACVVRTTRQDGDVRWVSRAGVSSRVIGAENTLQITSDSVAKALCKFELKARATVYVAICVTGGGTDKNIVLKENGLSRLSAKEIAKRRKAHDEWWREMWLRSLADTGDSLLNRQYLTSIYLLASATRLNASSCGGMYGVWNMEDNMMYHGDIHLNYNSQGGFYSVFSANRPELALPFFDFIEKVIPEGRRRAREELGKVHPSLSGKSYRGILFPVSALGVGYFYGEYWQQTMDAPFNVCLFSWYYEYTGDRRFLEQRAYPFIRECGDFYEDYLQKEITNDGYRYTITTGGHEGSWDLNPPSDLAFVEQVFTLLLRYSEVLGVDEERRALWQDIVAHLPAYKVIYPTKTPNEGLPVFAKNEAGWDWPAHVIQMHCAYPCETLDLQSDSLSLQLARNTLYYYGVSQRGFTETMNELGLSAF
ncbi:MAG: glycosyl hydrolase family 95 catalytic domain-containing protein, partial [Bacteroidaceae bacterium]